MFAFDPDGTNVWDTNETDCPFQIGGLVDSSLALSTDGKLLMAASITGSIAWMWALVRFIRLAHVSAFVAQGWSLAIPFLEILVSPTGVATSMGEGISLREQQLLYPLLILLPGTLSTNGQGEHPVIAP